MNPTMQLIEAVRDSASLATQFQDWVADYGDALDADALTEVQQAIAASETDMAIAVDAIAQFGKLLEADLVAAKARKDAIVRQCDQQIASICGQIEALQSMWLRFVTAGLVPTEALGRLDKLVVNTSQSVGVWDEDRIPDRYVRTEIRRVPDKAAIAAAFKQGIDVPGTKPVIKQSVKFKSLSQRDRARLHAT